VSKKGFNGKGTREETVVVRHQDEKYFYYMKLFLMILYSDSGELHKSEH
jgi:hypothetical protein